MAVQTQIQVRRGTASSWSSTNPTLAAGEIGFESDTGKIKVGTGSATWNSLTYIGAANAIQYVYTASAGQTTFSGADNNSLTLSYTVGAEQVYVNGVLQVRGTDYTATNGTSVVLTTATIASDIVTIIAYGTFTVADTYTQAQANATFPLNTSAFFAGKNKIINGDFGIWQRGTSFASIATGSYFADRFRISFDGSGVRTASRQSFTAGTAPVSGYEGQYFCRIDQTTAGTGGTYNRIMQRIESARTFAGQSVTLSFWVKADTNRTLSVEILQNFGSGGSPSAEVSTSTTNISATTSWTRVSVNYTLASVAGKTFGTNNDDFLQINLNLPLNALSTVDTWGWQLEAGSVATAFQTATGTIQGELAACQRYYWRATTATSGGGVPIATGYAYSTTESDFIIPLPVPMRVYPTSFDKSSTLRIYYGGSTYTTSATWSLNSVGMTDRVQIYATMGSATFTAGQAHYLTTDGAVVGYIGFSAEL